MDRGPEPPRVARSGGVLRRSIPRRRLVVIGNGMSGARAVEEILARGGGRQFTITMFGDEPCGNYDRTLLHRVLAGEDTPAGILLNTLAWYGDNGITLHAGVRVDRIDRFTRQVFSSDGRVTPYDALVIATGSRPYLPPLDGLYTPGGALKRGVFCFRTLEDARKLAAYLGEGARRAVVVGGGLSGFQAAAGPHAVAGLERRGLEVDVPQAAAAAVLGTDKVRGVRLRDHSEIACGIVVVAAGIRPNVELAVLSGLPVERGLVVDDSLRVQDEEDIYALGECAQHRGGVYSCLPPVWHQAAVLAGHLTGADRQAAFPGSRNPVENRAPGPGTRVV